MWIILLFTVMLSKINEFDHLDSSFPYSRHSMFGPRHETLFSPTCCHLDRYENEHLRPGDGRPLIDIVFAGSITFSKA